jgi:hypothetical protein
VHSHATCEDADISKIYDYRRHPRLDELLASRPIKVAHVWGVDQRNWITRFNARFGLKITLIVGTMWCAYLSR